MAVFRPGGMAFQRTADLSSVPVSCHMGSYFPLLIRLLSAQCFDHSLVHIADSRDLFELLAAAVLFVFAALPSTLSQAPFTTLNVTSAVNEMIILEALHKIPFT